MKVGIIGAMASEVALLKEQLSEAQVTRVAGMEFCEGALGGTPVVVVQCGIGKVNAGICVQVLVDRFGVSHVINTGVAGSLDDRLDVGDLVVSTDCVWHDFDVTPLGYRPGEIPGVGTINFPADGGLREATLAAAAQVAPDIHAYAGRVVSGDQFIASAEQKNRITEGFGGMCCEMEGTAIAQAAWLNEVPFVVVRAISDKPGAADQVVDYNTFEEKAARDCAAIVAHMVANPLRA